jgi:molybdopterin-guanine dinucleotide biosynthesis protein A
LEISCIILAGGRGIRLGRDKVLQKLGDKSLLEQVISRIEPITRDIIIVTAGERALPKLNGPSRSRVISDILPGRGSLGGLYTGLVTSDSHYNLVVACDMPFLNQPLLRYMTGVTDGYDAVMPRTESGLEPLHAIYSKGCLAPIESLFREDKKAIIELCKLVKVRCVEAEEVDRFDPQRLSFFNINTAADLARAERIVRGEEMKAG